MLLGPVGSALFCLPAVNAASAQNAEQPTVLRPGIDLLPNWSLSASIALASEWGGRGIAFTSEGPAVQGGFEITNGWFYAGVYGSNLELSGADRNNDGVADSDGGNFESDWYAGVRSSFGKLSFDFAYLFYSYNNAVDFGGDVDMWEIRSVVSTTTAWGLTPSFAAYYTPEYSYRTGWNVVTEAKLEQPLPAFGSFSPSVSALLGHNNNETGRVRPDFWFWNAGLTLGFAERFAFDLRYWDTDISNCDKRTVFQCDERVVARLTATIGEPKQGEMATQAPARLAGLTLKSSLDLVSDYVFRGRSQTDANPAVQGGFELGHHGFYAGVWASNLDYGGADANGDGIADSAVAPVEFDWYGGLKREFKGFSLDIGLIYNSYPDAFEGRPAARFDYFDFKAGATGSLQGFDLALTLFYSPDYLGEVGENWVYEAGASRRLPKWGPFTPSLSGQLAYNDGDEAAGGLDYWYWNAGLELAFLERFAFDLRYWDTDLGGCGSARLFQCDERMVAKLSAEF